MPRPKPTDPIIMRFISKANATKAAEGINPRAFQSIEILKDSENGGWMVVLTPKTKYVPS